MAGWDFQANKVAFSTLAALLATTGPSQRWQFRLQASVFPFSYCGSTPRHWHSSAALTPVQHVLVWSHRDNKMITLSLTNSHHIKCCVFSSQGPQFHVCPLKWLMVINGVKVQVSTLTKLRFSISRPFSKFSFAFLTICQWTSAYTILSKFAFFLPRWVNEATISWTLHDFAVSISNVMDSGGPLVQTPLLSWFYTFMLEAFTARLITLVQPLQSNKRNWQFQGAVWFN